MPMYLFFIGNFYNFGNQFYRAIIFVGNARHNCESRSMPSVSCPKSFEPIDIPSKFERSHLPIKCWTEFHTSRKFLSRIFFFTQTKFRHRLNHLTPFLRRPTKRNHRNHIFKPISWRTFKSACIPTQRRFKIGMIITRAPRQPIIGFSSTGS